ncbi:MAG TPA: head GIN domain-containing protein [Isosphaeraceae bacterium]|jgi:hypothetical protein|nr:head GIN domain-containing protein [Isosphaeraceae bacterium]
MRSTWMTLAVAMATVAVAGCNLQITGPALQGSGVSKTETRKVDTFHAVEVGGAIKATVKVGDKTEVVIEGDDNIIPLIETKVEDGRLVVRARDGTSYSTKKPLTATITATKLDALEADGASTIDATVAASDAMTIEASGAGNVSATGIDAKEVKVTASGASRVTAKGKGTSLTLDASGASHVEAAELAVESAKADLSGASDAKVHASKSVAGDISGASHLDVAGSPSGRSVTTSGVGKVSYGGSK